MSEMTTLDAALIFSLFRGREDVFAVRWEKPGKSGYIPSYSYDPFHYRQYKMTGGSFQNYPNKTYKPLSVNEIQKHLEGYQQIGIYPLLQDNTSRVLAADFDKKNWKTEALSFLDACKKLNIPAYLERSRSGNGGHVWIFFDKPYQASKSRKIFINILEQSGSFSVFDKNSSFDRLFPNQDAHSGKGLGNLIALPFFKTTMTIGNSCFINPDTFDPYLNQQEFLKGIELVSINILDTLYQEMSTIQGCSSTNNSTQLVSISFDQYIRIRKEQLPKLLIKFINDELNFANSEYFIRKKMGKSTFGADRYFNVINETETEITIPRGFAGKLLRFCKEKKIEYDFKDLRKLKGSVAFAFNATMRPHQVKTIAIVDKKNIGVIVAPPGTGKTVIGLKIIADKKQPAIIIVHRKQLLEQWKDRVEAFLGIPKQEIGIIGQGKSKIGKQITIATIQSLPKQIEQTRNQFGTVLVDECHHIPAKTFRDTIENIGTYYLYGLTATPFRKYNDGKLIFAYLGDVLSEITPSEIDNFKPAQIIIRNTSLDVPFNTKTDDFETLSKILIHDSERNKLILQDIKEELANGKRIAIITERKEHIDALFLFLKQLYEVITLSGDDSEKQRKSKWKLLEQGNFQALVTTGQFFGEGSDLSNISSLFLVYPFSFKGKLIQYIGRVQRSEINPTIYDYRDMKIDYLNKLFLKRNTYYRQISKQATLFDDPSDFKPEAKRVTIKKLVKVLFTELEFRYGQICFEYSDQETDVKLEFEIENHEIRPEFEVLKPYFSSVFKSKHITAEIYAEIENRAILCQMATSADIEVINRELIDSVKFRFLNNGVARQLQSSKQNLHTNSELPESEQIYPDADSILADLMKGNQYRHSKHIQYLATRHERNIMKLRFVLQPFSFVFLITGEQSYHIILETLDTAEATYIWHMDKDKPTLTTTIKQIDMELNVIRNKGRQYYLDCNPPNFSKIPHDYTDSGRGFISWKSQLEEQMF